MTHADFMTAYRNATDIVERCAALEAYDTHLNAKHQRLCANLNQLKRAAYEMRIDFAYYCPCEEICGCGVRNSGSTGDILVYDDLVANIDRIAKEYAHASTKWRIVSRMLRASWSDEGIGVEA